MSESKYTPGPWAVSQQQGLRLFIVGNDEAIAEAFPMAWDDERFANADLIAAAPDLLEALESAVKRGCGCVSTSKKDWHADNCPMPRMRAAIRKARTTWEGE